MRDLGAQRVCFLLHLKPDRVDDHLLAHQQVWPEVLYALRTAGWHNYSLFLRESDGLESLRATMTAVLSTETFVPQCNAVSTPARRA